MAVVRPAGRKRVDLSWRYEVFEPKHLPDGVHSTLRGTQARGELAKCAKRTGPQRPLRISQRTDK